MTKNEIIEELIILSQEELSVSEQIEKLKNQLNDIKKQSTELRLNYVKNITNDIYEIIFI